MVDAARAETLEIRGGSRIDDSLNPVQPLRSLGHHHPRVKERYPWLESFLRLTDMPERYHNTHLASILDEPMKRRAAIFGRLTGIPWMIIRSYVNSAGPYAPLDDVSHCFEDSSFQFSGKLRPEKDGQIVQMADGSPLRLFRCDFQVVPSRFARALGGMNEEAMYFGTFLPEIPLPLIPEFTSHINCRHLFGAFSYIRFYREGNDFIVTEIQSDHWRKIKDRHLKQDVYRNWDKVTLLAFERYAATAGNGENVRVILPDAEYIMARWLKADDEDPPDAFRREDFGGISESTARAYYERLPGDLEYERTDELIRTKEGNLKENELAILHPWVKMIPCSAESRVPCSSPLDDYIQVDDRHPFLSAYRELFQETATDRTGIKPFNITCSCCGIPLDAYPKADHVAGKYRRIYEDFAGDAAESSEDDFEDHEVRYIDDDELILQVPSREVDLGLEFPRLPELADIYSGLQDRFLQDVPDFAGKGGVVIVQHPASHPFRTVNNIARAKSQDSCWQYESPAGQRGGLAYCWKSSAGSPEFTTVEIYGGGTHHISSVSRKKQSFGLHQLIPYKDRSMVLHPLGTEYGVSVQLANTLGLHWFASETGLFPRDLLPAPVRTQWLSRFPLEDAERERDPETWKVAVDESDFILVPNLLQITTVSSCGLRMPLLIYAMMRTREGTLYARPEAGLEAAGNLLDLLYSFYGEEVNLPDPAALSTYGTMDFASFARYFAEVYRENSEAAERIISTFGERTLGLLGAVHGAGSMLSYDHLHRKKSKWKGSKLQRAISTHSESAPFNTDLLGTMHYFDAGTQLPWIMPKDCESMPPKQEAEIQRINLDEWAANYFWFQFLLRGIEGAHTEIELNGVNPRIDEWLARQPTNTPVRPFFMIEKAEGARNGLKITDESLQAYYEEQYLRGAKFREIV